MGALKSFKIVLKSFKIVLKSFNIVQKSFKIVFKSFKIVLNHSMESLIKILACTSCWWWRIYWIGNYTRIISSLLLRTTFTYMFMFSKRLAPLSKSQAFLLLGAFPTKTREVNLTALEVATQRNLVIGRHFHSKQRAFLYIPSRGRERQDCS